MDGHQNALNYLINKADLSVFDGKYNNDAPGAAAYPPPVLIKGIFYNYSLGVISSRRIENAYKTNIITKAPACDQEPGHAAVAAFVSTNGEAIQELFSRILLQCSEPGLVKGGMFATDGCKLPSNASKEWSGTLEELEKKREDLRELSEKIIRQHRQTDRRESKQKKLDKTCRAYVYGEEYQKRHIERIEKKLAKITAFLRTAEAETGSGGHEIQSNVTDNESAKIKGPHGLFRDTTVLRRRIPKIR